MIRSLLTGGLLGTLLFSSASCYSERLAPPAFRYQCQGDSDCEQTERCIANLCELPCTQLTFSSDCNTQLHVACFNGACASVCDLTDSDCPSPQSCIDFGIGGASLGSFGSFGVCSTMCTAESCPGSEVCLEGFCVASCDPADPAPCPDGLACAAGLCLPESDAPSSSTGTPPETTSATESATDTDSGSASTGASG